MEIEGLEGVKIFETFHEDGDIDWGISREGEGGRLHQCRVMG